MFSSKSILYPLSLSACLILTACGSTASKLTIKGVDISTSQVNQDTYVNMEAILLMGNLSFPGMSVPILNPKDMQPIGQLTLQHLSDNSNSLAVSIDYTLVSKMDPSLGSTLPNGREIPVLLGAGNSTLIGVPVLTHSKIYLGGDIKKDLFIGAAIAIPAFDNVMSNVPIPLNIFFNFPFSSEVSSVGGLFTGPTSGQNGVAVFVKKSSIPIPSTPQTTVLNQKLAFKSSTSPQGPSPIEQAQDGDNEINQLDQYTLYRLNRLFNKHSTVKVK